MIVDLILWRHAEAEDWTEGCDDLERSLTSRGEKQAARVAAWLDRQLPDGTRIMTSPARRCEQTVLAMGRKYKVKPELAPGRTMAELLDVAGWPSTRGPVLVVGHQPVLGEVIAHLLNISLGSCPVRKAGVWWIRNRERDGHSQTIVLAVQSPDVL